MNKKIICSIFLFLIILVGCTEKSKLVNTKETDSSNLSIESKYFSNEQLIETIKNGSDHFLHVISGGTIESYESFEYNGSYYRYFGADLDTREELANYLNEVYAKEITDQIITKYKFIEIEDKMAQPDADFGSQLDWRKAEIISINETETTIKVKLNVPLFNGELSEQHEIKLIKEEGDWVLDQEVR